MMIIRALENNSWYKVLLWEFFTYSLRRFFVSQCFRAAYARVILFCTRPEIFQAPYNSAPMDSGYECVFAKHYAQMESNEAVLFFGGTFWDRKHLDYPYWQCLSFYRWLTAYPLRRHSSIALSLGTIPLSECVSICWRPSTIICEVSIVFLTSCSYDWTEESK